MRCFIEASDFIDDACGGSSPHPQTTASSQVNSPKQSARTVWQSSPSEGSAGHRYKAHAATNEEAHEKMTQTSCLFWRFLLDFGGPVASQKQLAKKIEKGPIWKANDLCFWRAFWVTFRPFCWRPVLCLFLASLLGGLWQQFWRCALFRGQSWCHFKHFCADAAKLKKCNPFGRNAWFGRCRPSVLASFLLTFWMCFSCCFRHGLFGRF